jgi:hypothetical protein
MAKDLHGESYMNCPEGLDNRYAEIIQRLASGYDGRDACQHYIRLIN